MASNSVWFWQIGPFGWWDTIRGAPIHSRFKHRLPNGHHLPTKNLSNGCHLANWGWVGKWKFLPKVSGISHSCPVDFPLEPIHFSPLRSKFQSRPLHSSPLILFALEQFAPSTFPFPKPWIQWPPHDHDHQPFLLIARTHILVFEMHVARRANLPIFPVINSILARIHNNNGQLISRAHSCNFTSPRATLLCLPDIKSNRRELS